MAAANYMYSVSDCLPFDNAFASSKSETLDIQGGCCYCTLQSDPTLREGISESLCKTLGESTTTAVWHTPASTDVTCADVCFQQGPAVTSQNENFKSLPQQEYDMLNPPLTNICECDMSGKVVKDYVNDPGLSKYFPELRMSTFEQLANNPLLGSESTLFGIPEDSNQTCKSVCDFMSASPGAGLQGDFGTQPYSSTETGFYATTYSQQSFPIKNSGSL